MKSFRNSTATMKRTICIKYKALIPISYDFCYKLLYSLFFFIISYPIYSQIVNFFQRHYAIFNLFLGQGYLHKPQHHPLASKRTYQESQRILNQNVKIIKIYLYIQTFKMRKLVLLSAMLSLIMCLHVEHHEQSNNDPQTLGEAIQAIEAIRINATSDVDSSGKINFDGDGELVEFLEKVIDSQVDDLYNFETNLIPVVALNPHVCSNLTAVDRQKLVQKFESAQANVQKLVKTIQNIQNATLKQSFLRKANLQYLYIEQVKQGIQNDCKGQTIGTTAYFYNFNSSNWVYGQKYSQMDILNAYNTLANQGTVTICPQDRPFVVSESTECFKCPESRPVFDLSSQECISCPNGTAVNPNTHKCS